MKVKALVLTAALALATAGGFASPARADEGRFRDHGRREVRYHRYYRPYRAYGYRGYYSPYVSLYADPAPYLYPGPYAYSYAPYRAYYGPRLRFGIRLGW
jgi:hypothetical protein